ncbi:MAG: hypothetical protein LBU81_04300 [Methanosarcinales archaeon]|jgi:hypothetical protein|nr:hypothetical protein [Methanosarcinales archaeon]
MSIKQSQKLGLVLLLISAVIIGSVIGYVYLQSQTPDDKNLGEMMINWYIPDYDTLVADSDLIVIATVTDKTGIWDTDDGKKPLLLTDSDTIRTEYTFKPEDVLKGSTTTLIGRVYGGEVDGYTQTAMQTPSFEVGDKVLLFLNNNEDADGNRILWYHINWPGAFAVNSNGQFENPCYGEISIDQLTQNIADSETSS